MQAGGTGLADGFKDALHQGELVGRKGVHLRKFVFIGVSFEGAPGVGEAELVFEDVRFFAE